MKLKNDKSKFSPIMTVKWEKNCLNVKNVKYGCHGSSPKIELSNIKMRQNFIGCL